MPQLCLGSLLLADEGVQGLMILAAGGIAIAGIARASNCIHATRIDRIATPILLHPGFDDVLRCPIFAVGGNGGCWVCLRMMVMIEASSYEGGIINTNSQLQQ